MCEHEKKRAGFAGEAARVVDLTKMERRDMVRLLASGSLALFVANCSANPETGRSQLVLVDEGSLAKMSLDAWAEQKAKTPVSRDPALNARLTRVGQKIAEAAGRQNQPWEFVVFDTPEKNAFVLPGNKVGFYKGLMELATNDDQIAVVLGHEVAHVTNRHAAERFSQGTLAQVGLVGANVLASSRISNDQTAQLAVAAVGIGLQYGLLMPYSRLQETEADLVGLDYMHRAGYRTPEAINFWQAMGQQGGARPPAFLSTHPDPLQRIEAIKRHINTRGYAVV